MIDLENTRERAVLVTVDTGVEDCDALLDELEELADTAGADTVGRVIQKLECPDSATFVGTGKLEEIKEFAEKAGADLLIFDSELSPSQQRNIEKSTDIRTIDRTLLILDIFGQRANSGEGRIQVELARYQYMLPRLSGQGKNLSRQGGIGMKRGAGESKLESDRRHIRRRITALKEQLSDIEKRRENQRKRRKKNRLPTVAIVGYTNAGKSTLLNYLTDAGVLAKDMLFATLDPTARGLKLPDGQTVIFIDTVGLIRKLPHGLVDAFKSTLEEAAQADVILNICDASNPEADEHLRVTNELLGELGCVGKPIISVFNKVDKCEYTFLTPKGAVAISAKSGQGVDTLLKTVADALPKTRVRIKIILPFDKGDLSAVIRKDGTVHSEEYVETGLFMDCTVSMDFADRLSEYMV